MASTPEAKVKKQIRAILDGYGAYYAMPIGSGYGNSGVPDFLVCYKGWFIGIEAKAGKGKTTALQDLNLDNIKKAGGLTLIINEFNLQGINSLLNTLKDLEDFK
jgi:pantoate kinase